MLGSNPSRMASLGAAVNGLPDDPYGPASMPAAQPDFSNAPPVPIQGQAMPSAPLARLPQKAGFNWLTFGQNFINNYAAAQGSPVAQGWLKNQYDNEANSADQESKMKMMLARLQAEQAAKASETHVENGVAYRIGGDGRPVVLGRLPQAPTEFARLMAERGIPEGSPDWNRHYDLMIGQKEDPALPVSAVVNGQSYMGGVTRSQLAGMAHSGPMSGGANPLDAQPIVEDGHAYIPGPGGRANQANWHALAQGGPTRQGSATFP